MHNILLSSFLVLLHTYLHITGSSASPTSNGKSKLGLSTDDFVCNGEYVSSSIVRQSIDAAWKALFTTQPNDVYVNHVEDTRIFGGTSKTLFSGPIPIHGDYGLPDEGFKTIARVVFDFQRHLVGIITIHKNGVRHCREIIGASNPASFDANLHDLLGYKCANEVFDYRYVASSYTEAYNELSNGSIRPGGYPKIIDRPGSPHGAQFSWPLLPYSKLYNHGDATYNEFISFTDSIETLSVYYTDNYREHICPAIWTNKTPALSNPDFLMKHYRAPESSDSLIHCHGKSFEPHFVADNIKIAKRAHEFRSKHKLDLLFPEPIGDESASPGQSNWLWPLRIQEDFHQVRQRSIEYFLVLDGSFEFVGVFSFENKNYSPCLSEGSKNLSHDMPQDYLPQ
ncbi:CSEP0225 putative effector protein [Blumeria hordei DH14]|uniref:CSEP0225 putative effector protein n=1 Tax=Blumeria graminis f. sp. hordei (strain DH14) TaxID=546991 RepID=N1JAC2_BLUG1|nr:CSEP0225 putative effector protein [Blumeria hordei DH14]